VRVPGRGFLSCWAWLLCWAWWPARAGAEAEFAWPLALDRALSSTFGETRPAAFHAGIDLKTQGKTGFEVRAPAAGYILRVRTSPWGYGRSLYQKLADGHILVFAHLQGFAPPIAARVAQAQRAKQAYSVELEFKPDEIPIAQGELIAWSGDSGIGPPHLHLEVRDADNVPLNPLLNGFQVEDTLPPVFERLALVPVGLESQVEGGPQPVSVALRRAPDRYEAIDTLIVSGVFGVSAQLHDLANAAPNQLAPYRLRLEVDGKAQITSTYARVSYLDGHQVFLDRSRLEFPGGSGVFFNLFRQKGNRLEFYDLPPGADGLLHCGPGGLARGLHELRLQAEDAAGNFSQARLWVQVDELPRSAEFQLHPAGKALGVQVGDSGAVFSLDYQTFADFAELRVAADRPLTAMPLLSLADAQGHQTLALRQRGPQDYRACVQFNPAGGPLTVQVADRAAPVLVLLQQQVNPGQEVRVQWGQGEAQLRVDAKSAYAPFFPQARRFTPPAAEGLQSAGVGYHFTPARHSFDQQVEILLRYGPEVGQPQRLGLYQERGEGQWSFAGNELDTAQRLVGAKVRRLLRFALFSDTQAPSISALQPAPGAALKERQPLLRAQVDDIGSGIGREEDLVLKLDGQRLIAEYDPEAGTLSARPETPLKAGRHLLEVEVRDQSGNQAAARSAFAVR
jgi:hypothetical protein